MALILVVEVGMAAMLMRMTMALLLEMVAWVHFRPSHLQTMQKCTRTAKSPLCPIPPPSQLHGRHGHVLTKPSNPNSSHRSSENEKMRERQRTGEKRRETRQGNQHKLQSPAGLRQNLTSARTRRGKPSPKMWQLFLRRVPSRGPSQRPWRHLLPKRPSGQQRQQLLRQRRGGSWNR